MLKYRKSGNEELLSVNIAGSRDHRAWSIEQEAGEKLRVEEG